MSTKKITEKELHRNYIRLVKILHPDVNPNNPEADKQFQNLQEQFDKAKKILGANSQYQVSVTITLKEAIHGAERYFITDENQTFVLHIPAGVKHCQTIFYRGLNLSTIKDIVLHIKINIDLPRRFSIVGDQLILKEYVPIWKMYFGGKVSIIGADGKRINLILPSRTKNKKMFKINNMGLLDRIANKRLPLYIQFFGYFI